MHIDFSDESKPPEKPFPEYLLIESDDRKELFAIELKKNFNSEKGLALRYMLEGLVNLRLLTIGDREKKKIYASIKTFFNRNIGSYQSIFDSKDLHKQNIESAEKRIQLILKKVP